MGQVEVTCCDRVRSYYNIYFYLHHIAPQCAKTSILLIFLRTVSCVSYFCPMKSVGAFAIFHGCLNSHFAEFAPSIQQH